MGSPPTDLPLRDRPRAVAARRDEHAARLAPTLGMDRRRFLATSATTAALLLALNDVHGRFFDVDRADAAEPPPERPRDPEPPAKFILDMQTGHLGAGSDGASLLARRRFAAGDNPQRRAWDPALAGHPVTAEALGFESWVREVFVESETDMAVVGGTALTSEDAVRSRDLVNRLAGSRRALAHGAIRPHRPGAPEEMHRLARELRVDGWTADTLGTAPGAGPDAWRMDDEKVAYPAWERAVKLKIRTVCVQKGLLPAADYRSLTDWRFATVEDVGRAARDWPQLNFVVAHAAFRPLLDAAGALEEYRRTGRIPWVTDLAEIPLRYRVRNVYAELSTTFASTVVAFPELTAAILGQLVKGMGPDHVLWGTDSVWYGSPQWQIEAFRRFEIPEAMQAAHGFVPLEAGRGRVKQQILGENAAWLYHIPHYRQPRHPVPPDFKDRLDALRAEPR
jgi:predicted TIM-barrel fold metal-dependent hydrolase